MAASRRVPAHALQGLCPRAIQAPVPGPELPLLRAHPGLRALPRQPFVVVPTPVAPLEMEGLPAGRAWVKRDDRSCPLYGGNKPRKLEFVLGRALARGARTLVTTGGLGTNHGLATTILGRSVGLDTVLVLVDQPLTESVRETLRLQCAYGARQVYARHVAGAVVQTLRVLATATLAGARPELVPTGGSSARGDVGLVAAAFELAEQVRDGLLPEPAEIWLPVGSGGSMAGLVLGLRLAGLRSRVSGVLVTDILPPSPARLRHAARATLRLLRRTDPSVPAVALGSDDFPLVRDQLGGGYGAPTPEGLAVQSAAREVGLTLETTYGAKTLAGLRQHLAHAPSAGPVLFWHTYNGIDVAAAAPRQVADSDLPAALRHHLARAS